MPTRIYTHVTNKALKGIQNLARFCGKEVYLYPVPYARSDGQTGWTVAVKTPRRSKRERYKEQ